MKTIHKSDVKNFNAVKFVLKARATDEIKPIFSKLFVKTENNKKVLVCTDSMRLHLLKGSNDFYDDLKDGLYDIIKSDSKEIVLNESELSGQFPDYEQIIPKKESLIKTSEFNVSKEKIKETGIIYRDFYKNFPDSSICMRPKFIEDIFINNYDLSILVIKATGENKPVYDSPVIFNYDVENLQAVIMPMLKF